MKNTNVFIKLIFILAICSFFWQCKNSSSITVTEPDNKDGIIYIGNLLPFKSHYKSGETFNTMGDSLGVRNEDDILFYITSGFSQEWADDWEDYDSYAEWYNDDSAWLPIRHGDPLPVPPPVSLYPYALPSVFYVRADYMGMKGNPSPREVRR
jgi:hypothetical protein